MTTQCRLRGEEERFCVQAECSEKGMLDRNHLFVSYAVLNNCTVYEKEGDE